MLLFPNKSLKQWAVFTQSGLITKSKYYGVSFPEPCLLISEAPWSWHTIRW